MIISLNWLKKYIQWDIPTEELVELIGSRLVEVEEVIDERGRYDNIYIARVETAEKIEGTHLTLCNIEVGQAKLVQVLCGAPNVRAGMLAAWIAPGATVPASFHEDVPFVLGVRKIRGYDSNGMLAGADELGFGDDHSGIAEFDPAVAKPGDKLAELFGLDDILLDIENKSLTHRPDCFGVIGFAREVAGILGKPFTEPEFLVAPGSSHIVGQEKIQLDIKITDTDLCPRYEALVMSRKDKPGAQYLTELQTLISRAGMRPIDPIVDMTNYLMLLTGQPLHAFDWDKLVAVGEQKTAEIVVRAAQKGEDIVLLDGRKVALAEDDILICSGKIPVALAGAMGGANTTIDKDTKRIIVESATFSLYNLRKTQMKHGIFSEAITRFTKGQPARLTDPVVREFAREMAGSLTPLALFDEYPQKLKPPVVKITTEQINALLGTEYSTELITSTLQNVGFTVAKGLAVTPPFWRTDIHIPEDIAEEVGRLLGYDNITPVLPELATRGAQTDPLMALKSEIRAVLASSGANETLTYSFVHGDLLRNVGQDPEEAYKIVNSLSPDLEYFREQLAPSLLSKVPTNIKDGYEKFAIYEMNQIFVKSDGLGSEKVPLVSNNLALVYTDTKSHSTYYAAKALLEHLADYLGVVFTFGEFAPNLYDTFYEPGRSASIYIGEKPVGAIGELKRVVAAKLKIPEGTTALEISLDDLLVSRVAKKLSPIAVLPATDRDVSLIVGASVSYAEVYAAVAEALRAAGLVFRISPVSIYQGADQSKKTVTLHLEFASPDKTLTKDEISVTMETVEKLEVK